MEKYVCLNCKFKFKSVQTPKSCPYCDKSDIQKEQAAADILNEVEDLLNE